MTVVFQLGWGQTLWVCGQTLSVCGQWERDHMPVIHGSTGILKNLVSTRYSQWESGWVSLLHSVVTQDSQGPQGSAPPLRSSEVTEYSAGACLCAD